MIETEFTPWAALLGGAFIGLGAVMLMGSLGRIFGGTGIVAGLLPPTDRSGIGWRLTLIAGMICGPLAVWAWNGQMPAVQVPVTLPALIIGGFIAGFGATLGSGCPSGHGVCGIARLSRRSILATVTFMITCALTVYVTRHLIGA